MASTKLCGAVERRGSLANGVCVEVHAWADVFYVVYLGSTEALLSERCLTRSMLGIRKKFQQGDPRGLRDKLGDRFNLHSVPTKATPGRMRLRRWVSLPLALQLPGVRELFPEGLPEPEPVEARIRRMQIERKRSDSGSYSWDQFTQDWNQLSDYDKGIARVAIKRIVSDSKKKHIRESRPTYLRLIVDNTKETNHV